MGVVQPSAATAEQQHFSCHTHAAAAIAVLVLLPACCSLLGLCHHAVGLCHHAPGFGLLRRPDPYSRCRCSVSVIAELLLLPHWGTTPP